MKLKTESLNIEELKRLIREARTVLEPSFLLETPEALEEVGAKRNKKYGFKSVYLFGPAGSGKGFISTKFLGIPQEKHTGDNADFKTVNPDDMIEDIFPAFGITLKFANAAEGDDPELEKFQQGVRNQIQQWAKNRTNMWILGAQPLLFDTTGENVKKMSGRIKSLGKLGYTIGVAQIYVPEGISVARDQSRERTVGAERTAEISQRYKKEVLDARGYFEALASEPNVHMIGDSVYPNVFQLDEDTGTVGPPLDGVTQDMLDAMDITQEKAQAMITKMRNDASDFLGLPMTDVATKLYEAQLMMLKITGKGGGEHYGNSLPDLELIYTKAFQEKYPEAASHPVIKAGADYLVKLGGVESFAQSKGGPLRGDKPELDGTLRSQDSEYKVDDPVKVGDKFPSNVDPTKGEYGPDHRQGRRGNKTRKHEEQAIREVVKNVVLKMRKELDE